MSPLTGRHGQGSQRKTHASTALFFPHRSPPQTGLSFDRRHALTQAHITQAPDADFTMQTLALAAAAAHQVVVTLPSLQLQEGGGGPLKTHPAG